MNVADLLANAAVQALVTFREGFEIGLIITMLLAFLTRSGRRAQHRSVWIGVGASAAVCVVAAIVAFRTFGELTGTREMVAEGSVMIVAAGVMTWMITWMRSHARSIGGDLRDGLALATTSGAVMAFAAMAVAREGFETVMILLSANAQTSSPLEVAASATVGFGAAALLCALVYRSGRRMDLAKFFRYTGLALVAFATYSLAMGVHEFIELTTPGELVELAVGIGVPAAYGAAMLRWLLAGERRPATAGSAQRGAALTKRAKRTEPVA